jgi:hypothetical protein
MFLRGSLLHRDRILHGDSAIIRCHAIVGLSALLLHHAESWDILSRKQMRLLEEVATRWNNGGFIQKLTWVLKGGQDSERPPVAINLKQATKASDDDVVPVSLEGIEGKVDARA